MTHIEKMRLHAALKEQRGKSILAALCDGHSDVMCTSRGRREWASGRHGVRWLGRWVGGGQSAEAGEGGMGHVREVLGREGNL